MPTRITTFSLTKEWTAKETTQALATARSSESASADTLEELAAKLGFDNDAASTFVASIERYNELCVKGHDDDFGKAAEKMHPIIEPPFKAVTYDTLKHTSVEDVSCMRRRCRQSLYIHGPITLRVYE